MSRTITALFDTRADAEAGKQRLIAAHVDASNINIQDQSNMGSDYSTHQDRGVWGSTKNAFLPDEDRHTYEEGLRRGGVLLTADIDGDDAGAAVKALESADSVDIDERAGKWRSEGWGGAAATAGAASTGASSTGKSSTGSASFASDDTRRDVAGEERIQLAEEQLVVGKREVEHGGVRVRSYVTERPVHEQISLREERVNIERRPVDQAVSTDTNLFQERSIDMTATAEEAVVGKTARVTEELVVSKTADNRVETIDETVRKTEVDIDQSNTSDRDVGRTGSTTGGSMTGGTSTGGVADTAAGLGKEALGNVKQGLGNLTGNESLKRDGKAQERSGEAQQGKRGD